MFGGLARRTDSENTTPATVWQDDAPVTPLHREDEGLPDLQPLQYEGFSSGVPLLVERPTRFVNRIKGAAESLIIPPTPDDGNGDAFDRMLLSPMISLPFPVLYGTESLTSEEVVGYPMLHQPDNRPWDPNGEVTLEQYALTMIVAFNVMNIMAETGHDLVAYSVPVDSFEVDGDLWDECADWARENGELLASLNIGRFLLFGSEDVETEEPMWRNMVNMWNIEGDAESIMGEAQHAADLLQPAYEAILPDVAFTPFDEA